MNTNKQIQWITVKSFATPLEAHMARTALENEGIEAFVRDEHTIGMRPYLSQVLGGVRVDVREQDFGRACALLDLPAPAREPKPCPVCAGEGARGRDVRGYLAAICATLFTIVPGRPLKTLFRCSSCGHEWRK